MNLRQLGQSLLGKPALPTERPDVGGQDAPTIDGAARGPLEGARRASHSPSPPA
jgi:hypothetical protein